MYAQQHNTETRRLAQAGLRVLPLRRMLFGAGHSHRRRSQMALTVRVSALAAMLCWMALTTVAQDHQQGSPLAAAPFAGARIVDWTGKVEIQLPGVPLSGPSRGQILPPGAVLNTEDGRLLLVLRGDESEILIRPHSHLLLKQPSAGDWNYFELLLGRIRAYIKKRTGGAPPFQMGTPSAVIAVRGTRFDVEVNSRGVSEIDVFDGLVEVGAKGIPGVSVLVKPGFSTRVAVGSAPEPPVPTQEIRPGGEASDEVARRELARDRKPEMARAWDNEMAERPDSEIDELVDESREAEKPSRTRPH